MKNKTVGFIGGKFLPFHQGHVFAIMQAYSQVDELYVILTSSEKRDKEICENSNIKYMSAEKRMSWIGESLNDFENIKLINIVDNQTEEDYDWDEGANNIKNAIGKPIDYIFSSEPQYDEMFKKNYPDAKHIIIDQNRNNVNISATEIRKDVYKNWDYLPQSVKKDFVKKVVVVGTESCGKSELSKKLAKYYNTEYVQEVGRDYCNKYSNQLTKDMFDDIAMEHYLLQKTKSEDSNKILLVDSEAVITQYYLDMYFDGTQSALIEEIIKKQEYDLMIYLEPDVKWVKDEFRFAGEDEIRKQNNNKLKQMYKDRGIDFVEVNGNYKERFDRSIGLIDKLFEK
ncbi:multifunctional transcriptional regulator/nicotinamide-nucleotide adenylyltransferase/ribosylnicotinamide kinase NadR [Nanoarchaeota archaeon]